MVIENMDPEEKSVSAMERITSAAEAAGAVRREKIMKTIDRVLGAPEAAGMALTIAGENLTDMKDRAEQRLVETAMDLAERADNSWARFTNRVTETKDKAVAKAKDLGNRALKMGLSAGTWVEDRVVAACELPADLMEAVAGREEFGAEKTSVRLEDVVGKQAQAALGLSESQAEQLRQILAQHEARRLALETKQVGAREKLQKRIEGARESASGHRADAAALRTKVEGRRVFKGWLARVTA